MAWLLLGRGTRARAGTAALLSSVAPGLGQLYNGDWLRAAAMGAGTLALALVIKGVLGRVLATALPAIAGTGITVGAQSDPMLQLVTAMTLPEVQSEIRGVLLPALLGLCALVAWSMIDAYRRARRES
jgi:hypothetical protein